MATITVRNIEESIKKRLRLVSARHDCSMEEEVRRILRQALTQKKSTRELGSVIHKLFAKEGGVELHIPKRSMVRPAPAFDKEN